MIIRLSGRIVFQQLLPPQRPAEFLSICSVHGTGGQTLNRLIVGSSRMGQDDIRGGQIALHPVLRDVHASLDAAVRGRHLRKIGQFLLVQLPHTFLQKLFLRYIHENAVKILFTSLFLQQLGLDGDPLHRSVLTDQPVLVVNRVAMGQLPVQPVCHNLQVIGVNDGSHGIPHSREFLSGIAQEFKQTVIGVNHRKLRVKTAPEHGAWNVIIKIQDLFPGLFLSGDIDADRHDRRSAVFRRHLASLVVNPDIGAVALLHPVLGHILPRDRYLTGHLAVHPLPVLRMHAVGNHSADIPNKGLIILIAQIIQHPPVDKVKWKSFLYVSAHHAARQRIVQQLLTLFCDVLHDKRLRIVFLVPLLVAGFCKMKALNQPHTVLPHQNEEAAQEPGI